MSKNQIIETYRKCGSVLHRGTRNTMRLGETIEAEWVEYISERTQLAINLLSHHAVVMRGDNRAIFCELATGRVWAASAR